MDDVTLMVRICKWIIMRIKWINGKVSWSQKDTVWWYRTHRGKFIYFHPEEDLVLALTPSGSYFLYHAEWTIINFSITTVWQRTSKAPMGLAHQKPEKNTIPWYLRLGTGIFHNTLRGIVPLAMQLVLFYSKSDTRNHRSDMRKWHPGQTEPEREYDVSSEEKQQNLYKERRGGIWTERDICYVSLWRGALLDPR